MVTIATEGDNDLSAIRIYYWWLQGRSVLLSASISYLSVLTAPLSHSLMVFSIRKDLLIIYKPLLMVKC